MNKEMMQAKANILKAARILSSTKPEDVELSSEARKTAALIVKFIHEAKLARMGKAVLLCAILGATSGCGLFMRDFEIPGVLKLTFPEGIDVHAGTNSIDRVDDRRGVSPIVEQRAGMTNKKY